MKRKWQLFAGTLKCMYASKQRENEIAVVAAKAYSDRIYQELLSIVVQLIAVLVRVVFLEATRK